ncbi:hypothetical protein [Spirulina sp. 06S082]|uniref:hypothetical protein n=1 Tax=Spirulina sp. 06S082 TaxID=3110248 RepID=UPI002B1EB083|nr:hypothetical protein [Spirulina sp. 06S082]
MEHPKQVQLLDIPEQGDRPSSNPRTQKMLRLLLEMDCSNELIAALLELSEFSIHHIRYLAGPISVHQCSWSESLPQWLPKAIYLDRFDAIVAETEKGIVGELATPSEVAACIYPATLIAPLERYWAAVYLWAANESMTKHGKLPEGRTFWEVQGIQPVQMSGYIKTECYDRIARDIRRRVVEAGKQRGWGKKRKAVKSDTQHKKQAVANPSDDEGDRQISLF